MYFFIYFFIVIDIIIIITIWLFYFINKKIYLILQVSRNTYIISNDNGTYIYEGSILEITRENLEIKEIITDIIK